ncbi:MAG: hypothetical protein WDZ26_01245 [Nitriliruptoraceae bacterium]
MRRAFASVSVVLLLVLLAVPAAADEPAASDDVVLLAVEGGDLGPEPQPREAEENRARELAGYENPEVPFTWGAAWILTFAGFVGLALLVGLYWFGVYRPSRASDAS